MTYIPYPERLKDPRWQKRRLELLNAADWKCQECGAKTETLHVHHGCYLRKTDPWDYPDDTMHVLCERHHAEMQEYLEQAHLRLAELPMFDVFLVSELLCSLSDSPDRTKILAVFESVACVSNSTGHRINPDEAGYAWLLRATLLASTAKAEENGYERGIKEEQDRAKGVHAATFS